MLSGSLPIRAPRIGASSLAPCLSLRLSRWDGTAPTWPTEVGIGHDGAKLILDFHAYHDGLIVDPAAPTDRATPGLWQRDVVEVFLSDDPRGTPYREIEVSPLGQWLTLAFDAPRVASLTPWRPTLEIQATCDARSYRLNLGIRLDQLRTQPEGYGQWRIGIYRIGGKEPHRDYSAHTPTTGTAPDFHQPACWTPLVLD